jgi:hypothetical protein
MAIDPAAARLLRVVAVEHHHTIEAKDSIERLERFAIAGFADDVVAGRDEVAGVQTHTHSRRSVQVVEDGGQVLEAVADSPSLAGGVFQQHHCPAPPPRLEGDADAIGNQAQGICLADGGARPRMDHDAEQAKRLGPVQFVDEGGQ